MSSIDLHSPEFLADPYPTFRHLRETAPLFPLQPGAWLVTRHAEADRILRDPRFAKDYLSTVARRYGPDAVEEPVFQVVNRFMLVMNPPEHLRLRALVGKAFGVKQAAELRRLALDVAETLVEGFIGQGRADLMAALAYPLPVRVICAMLGLRLEDNLEFQRETQALARVFEMSRLARADIDAANHAARMFDGYFRAVCRARRQAPGDDLISLLLRAEDGDQRLSEDEIVANITLLFVAGHETTANMLGNTLLSLHRHPDQLARLQSRPDLLPQAVNEALRYEPAVQIAARAALEDVALGGVGVRRGETLYVGLGAANRDPAAFPEPDAFRIDRPGAANPLSFGGGVHYCLGARLARIELETALAVLFRRLPGLELPDGDRPRWKSSLTIRGLERLEAVW
ncbi:Cytochrome P450 [Methylomagnum ishizawai]|uniref:Cytochrome P450 n=1 Tax=Methylomagnum ishizawai TaxID=1760988 RepID=A0A1Y6CXF8_9GAMM|nr:cytochrome P450 [Methylomagnum ishizawai]SMF94930.1 Cytochrome P450 [Methylomagnum ishizawai]